MGHCEIKYSHKQMITNILNQSKIKLIIKTALQAGEIAMSYFGGDNLNVKRKSDDSLLTIADSLISELIHNELKKITPDIPVICEEGSDRDFGDGTFWLIDPIDGTVSFANNDPEFTINISLIKDKKPIFGLIFAPAIDGLPFYYTDENQNLVKYSVTENKGKIFIAKKRIEDDFLVIASKRSSDEEILNYLTFRSLAEDKPEDKLVNIQKISSSLKFLYLIEGRANLYLHLRRSMEWDIAAGQALLEAAGGKIINLDKSDFKYEKVDLINQPFLAVF